MPIHRKFERWPPAVYVGVSQASSAVKTTVANAHIATLAYDSKVPRKIHAVADESVTIVYGVGKFDALGSSKWAGRCRKLSAVGSYIPARQRCLDVQMSMHKWLDKVPRTQQDRSTHTCTTKDSSLDQVTNLSIYIEVTFNARLKEARCASRTESTVDQLTREPRDGKDIGTKMTRKWLSSCRGQLGQMREISTIR